VSDWGLWAIVIGGAYLLGAIPFAIVIARAKGVDIRAVGSGNAGATNVWRCVGKGPGALCFLCDFLKGFLPVLLGAHFAGALGAAAPEITTAWLWLGLALAPVVGHIYPVFTGFRGGKGVATGFGAMLAVWPHFTLPVLAALVVWLVALRLSGSVGLSSSVAAMAFPVAVAARAVVSEAGIGATWPFPAAGGLLALLVVWRHRSNLRLYFSGEEAKRTRARADRSGSNAPEAE